MSNRQIEVRCSVVGFMGSRPLLAVIMLFFITFIKAPWCNCLVIILRLMETLPECIKSKLRVTGATTHLKIHHDFMNQQCSHISENCMWGSKTVDGHCSKHVGKHLTHCMCSHFIFVILKYYPDMQTFSPLEPLWRHLNVKPHAGKSSNKACGVSKRSNQRLLCTNPKSLGGCDSHVDDCYGWLQGGLTGVAIQSVWLVVAKASY